MAWCFNPNDSDDDDYVLESIDLGRCCSCGKEDKTVRNLMSLSFRAPVAGTGWGCFQCGLPPDGAQAVICDSCYDEGADILEIIKGFPGEKQRQNLEGYEKILFDHDESKH